MVSDEGRVERVEPAPVNERGAPSGDRIEVPVYWLAEGQPRVPEEIEAAAAYVFRNGDHLVPGGGHPVDQQP